MYLETRSEHVQTQGIMQSSKALRPGKADSAKRGSKHFREAIQDCSPGDVLWRVTCAGKQLSSGDSLAALPAIARSIDAELFVDDPRVRRLACQVAGFVMTGPACEDTPQVATGMTRSSTKLLSGSIWLQNAMVVAMSPRAQEFRARELATADQSLTRWGVLSW